jgi:hypothetical protein
MYHVLAADIFPARRLEEPDLFFLDGEYHMMMEDNAGVLTGSVRHGGHLASLDGLDWSRHAPVKVYTPAIEWADGTTSIAERRERPELFNADAAVKGNGDPTHLVTAVLHEGESCCILQPIAPPQVTGCVCGGRWSRSRNLGVKEVI